MNVLNYTKLLANTNLVALLIGIVAAAVVGSAWLFELAGYLPCQLCLWQRIPYYIMAPLLVVAGVVGIAGMIGQRITRTVLAVATLTFIASLGLAAYHSGVEWGFWPGPSSCGSSGSFDLDSSTNLLETLSRTQPPSCTDAAGRFWGLSFAGWNAVASLGLVLASITAWRGANAEAA